MVRKNFMGYVQTIETTLTIGVFRGTGKPTLSNHISHSVFGQFLSSKRIARPSSQERYGYRRNLKNMYEDHNYLSNYQMILIMAFCPPSSVATHFSAVPDSYSSRSRTSTDTIGAVANA